MPDPWDPRQAITATALYLTSMGANTQTYTAERSAACKYYTGPGVGCSSRSGANYGNQVMAKAKSIQENMIDADVILTEEEKRMLDESVKREREGKLVSLEAIKDVRNKVR